MKLQYDEKLDIYIMAKPDLSNTQEVKALGALIQKVGRDKQQKRSHEAE